MIAQAVSVAMSGRLVAAGIPARLLISRVGREFLLWGQPRRPRKPTRTVSCTRMEPSNRFGNLDGVATFGNPVNHNRDPCL